MKALLPIPIIVLVLLVLPFMPANAQSVPFHTAAEQAILLDYDTGMVLFEKNADQRMPTSSMSKVLTMYAVFQALEDGRLSLDSTLPVSEKAWRMGGSKMFVEVNDSVKVEDLIRGVVVQSGNDATIVLAEGIAGSEEAFAISLNDTAKNLGMDNSHFVNASGWPDPDHYSTTRDLARLAIAIARDFPDYYHYYGEKEFTYNNIKQGNRNPLLYRNIGADGIKTGHTEDAGYGLMASGVLGNRRVVLVLNGMDSMQERADEGARLLEWGLNGFTNVELFAANEIVEQVNVVLGMQETMALTVKEDIVVTLPLTVKNDLKVEAVFQEPVIAPVQAGQEIGVLKVSVPRVAEFEVPLVAAESVARPGFFSEIYQKLKLILAPGVEAGA